MVLEIGDLIVGLATLEFQMMVGDAIHRQSWANGWRMLNPLRRRWWWCSCVDAIGGSVGIAGCLNGNVMFREGVMKYGNFDIVNLGNNGEKSGLRRWAKKLTVVMMAPHWSVLGVGAMWEVRCGREVCWWYLRWWWFEIWKLMLWLFWIFFVFCFFFEFSYQFFSFFPCVIFCF